MTDYDNFTKLFEEYKLGYFVDSIELDDGCLIDKRTVIAHRDIEDPNIVTGEKELTDYEFKVDTRIFLFPNDFSPGYRMIQTFYSVDGDESWKNGKMRNRYILEGFYSSDVLDSLDTLLRPNTWKTYQIYPGDKDYSAIVKSEAMRLQEKKSTADSIYKKMPYSPEEFTEFFFRAFLLEKIND